MLEFFLWVVGLIVLFTAFAHLVRDEKHLVYDRLEGEDLREAQKALEFDEDVQISVCTSHKIVVPENRPVLPHLRREPEEPLHKKIAAAKRRRDKNNHVGGGI